MIRDADVVVIGAGGFGASTAYHLVRRGGRRVALLDRDEVGSQTSPRAAGLTSKVASTEVMVGLVDEAVSPASVRTTRMAPTRRHPRGRPVSASKRARRSIASSTRRTMTSVEATLEVSPAARGEV